MAIFMYKKTRSDKNHDVISDNNNESEAIQLTLSTENSDHTQNDSLQDIAQQTLSNLKEKNLYSLHKLIGQGGMGVVEQVTDSHCSRNLALKTLHKDCNSKEAYIRFTEEVQITAQLEHPNILPVYEMGVDKNEQIFYTMKLIKGRNLKEILRDIKNNNSEVIESFPLSRLLGIFLNICDAMSYTCSHKVIHRDIKPENIMIGEFGEVYLVDWGLAKVLTEEGPPNPIDRNSTSYPPQKIIAPNKTQHIQQSLKKIKSLRNSFDSNVSLHNIIVGTPHYMAPERFTGEADEVSEIYSLGSTLYNILTLKLTIDSSDVEVIIDEIISGNIQSPQSCKGKLAHIPQNKVPAALSAIALKALSPDRELRYQKINELKKDITRWQSGFVTKAENAGFQKIFWLALKRHKIESSLIALFLPFLGAIYFFFILEIEQQKELFQTAKIEAIHNRDLIIQQSSKIGSNSLLMEKKLNELKALSEQFYTSALKSLKNRKARKALKHINSALRLDSKLKFFTEKAFLLLLIEKFDEAQGVFQELQKVTNKYQDLLFLLKSINNKNNSELIQVKNLLQLRSHVLSHGRVHDAAIYNQKIQQRNKNLLKAIIEDLSKTNFHFINKSHLSIDSLGQFSLNASHQGLTSLDAIKGIPFKRINIEGNPITDLSPLIGMPLKVLNISSTLITDLQPLKELPLQVLEVHNTSISDITSLKNIPLQRLDLSSTKIHSIEDIPVLQLNHLSLAKTDISQLKHLQKAQSLRFLDISDTKTSTLQYLKRLQLAELIISDTKINSLSPLSHQPLHTLTANNLNIKSLQPLAQLSLKNLSLANTPISSLMPLKNCQLERLYINNTKIKDLSILANMPLKELDISSTPVTYIEFNESLKSLKNLNLSYTKIRSLPNLRNAKLDMLNLTAIELPNLDQLKGTFLKSLILDNAVIGNFNALNNKRLNWLSAKGCGISNIDFLSKAKINSLDLSHNPINDLSVLKNMPIIQLNINNTLVTDLEFLRGKLISSLSIAGTNITDISVLENSSVEMLDLSETNIQDFSILKTMLNLKNLNLERTGIQNLHSLLLYNIQELNLLHCANLKDFNQLKNAKKLIHLKIPSKLTKISFLENNLLLQTISNEHEGSTLSKNDYLQKHPFEVAP
jgi:serine/threonine protein kinase